MIEAKRRANRKYEKSEKGRISNRRAVFKYAYGITEEEKLIMIAKQQNRCANPGCMEMIDRTTGHLDHNHNTNKIRGVLCAGCNHALGKLKENLMRIIGLADYLKQKESL